MMMEYSLHFKRYVLRFGWAIPDERALSIIKVRFLFLLITALGFFSTFHSTYATCKHDYIIQAYGPIIEIGAGLGYWGRLLRNRGVDYVGYDVRPSPDGRGWCKINAGERFHFLHMYHEQRRTLFPVFIVLPENFSS